MSIDDLHPQYEEYASCWDRARDVIGGNDDVKKAAEKYLPRLEGMSNAEYGAYITRSNFFNATARTLEGLTGMIFLRQPTITTPKAKDQRLEGFLKDADMKGTALNDYTKEIVREVLAVGRGGTLTDWNTEENRPYFAHYKAEDILNWKVSRIAGRMYLTEVVLHEIATNPEMAKLMGSPDTSKEILQALGEYGPEVDQRRVLKLVSDGLQPPSLHYFIEIYQRAAKQKKDWVLVESIEAKRNGRPVPFIPFIFHGPRHSKPDVDKLPLDDMIALNLDHYRLDADYKHGLHFTGLPTAWVAGFDMKSQLRIGSGTAWVSENVNAKAAFLEFTGQGLGALKEALERDELLMAVMGARLLEQQKKAAETAESMRLRQGGEASTLINLALSLTQSLSNAFKIVFWWTSTEESPEKIGDDKIAITLNTDFISQKLPPDELTALVSSWMLGGLSQKTLFYNLRRGEILPPGIDDESEIALIEVGKPAMPEPTGAPPKKKK